MLMRVELLEAQSYENSDPYLMDQIINQMSEQLNDVPVNIKRVAVYKINYSAFRFTNEEIEYIRGEVEYAFRSFASLTVLSPPELEPNDKMRIIGSDSTLNILNIRGRSLADVSPELLNSISTKYSVHGLIELGVQRREPEGIVLSIRIMNPSSREIIWTKSFISNIFEVKEEVYKGKTFVVNFGAGRKTTDRIFTPDSMFTADGSLVLGNSNINEIVVDLHATATFRQPLHLDNSAYVGFTGGVHALRARDADEFSMTLLEFGITYYQAITPKNLNINDYTVMFFLNGNIQFPLGDQKGEMFSVAPGLMLNLSENIGLALYGNVILSGETITLENNQQITYNKVGYGIQGIVRF